MVHRCQLRQAWGGASALPDASSHHASPRATAGPWSSCSAMTTMAALRVRADQRLTSPLVSWVGLAGCAALCTWQPLWELVGGAPVLLALGGLRQMLGGKIRWHTGTMASP